MVLPCRARKGGIARGEEAMRKLACCTRKKEISIDFDEHYDKVVTYDGLESIENHLFNGSPFDKESSSSCSSSRDNGCLTTSVDEDASSCSSSKDVFGSCSSEWWSNKQDEQPECESNCKSTPKRFSLEDGCPILASEVDCMKERFAKLLLGDDASGGCKGLSSAVALSSAVTNLATSVFGELWKLEPLSDDRLLKWQREMDWLLSPTNYMVELVPAKQNGSNGRILDIMTPKVRSDIHINLPALRKLDSMLLETLDSMVDAEFWYTDEGSRALDRRNGHCKKWWFPSPRVPMVGLSMAQRKKLLLRGKMVYQVLKAAKSINQQLLQEMPAPCLIKDAQPKSVRASLGKYLYKAICLESLPAEKIFHSLSFKSEHTTLDIANRLETTVFIWKQKLSEQASSKSPARQRWTFVKDVDSEIDKMNKAQQLLQLIKTRFPNLPHTFLEVTKVQFNKDVGHALLEAYSRVLSNLAFRILSRIGEILQEDDSFKELDSPCSYSTIGCYSNLYLPGIAEHEFPSPIRHALADQMKNDNEEQLHVEVLHNRGLNSPLRKAWCYGGNESPLYSP